MNLEKEKIKDERPNTKMERERERYETNAPILVKNEHDSCDVCKHRDILLIFG